jgi:NADPH-dependent 2,4-dienoyl-CoA reductase/sulfur reductase-like enzyme
VASPAHASRVVVVGAGLGGLRAAEQLRTAGYSGQVVVLGDEPHLPYSRPPLSKEGLATGLDHETVAFRRKASVDDVVWRLGGPTSTVTGADLAARTVHLADGTELAYDGLVMATGVSARRLPLDAPLPWRRVVRTLDDATTLREHLTPGTHVVVIGAGFIGCEVAATARLLGCEVDVVDPMAVPLLRPLGAELGGEIRRRHEGHGVRFHLGRTIAGIDGDDGPRQVTLDDGTGLPATVVVEAVGSVPNVAWLEGNSLDLADGVRCDTGLRAVGPAGPLRDAVAVGDIARFPNVLFDDVPRRVEHWNFPTETAKRAGRVLAADLAASAAGRDSGDDADPIEALGDFTPMPAFWSDQFDIRLQSFGLPGIGGDDIRLLEGELAAECAVGYHRDGVLVGVVFLGLAARFSHYRGLIAARQPTPAQPDPISGRAFAP